MPAADLFAQLAGALRERLAVIADRELYERLKKRGVLVVPGSYFFPGFDEPWPHKHECIRVTYCAQPDKVRRGIAILADEVKKAYA